MIRRSAFRILPALAACLGVACSSWRGAGPPKEVGVIYRTFESQASGMRKYAMWIPKEYNASRKEWPTILFLHGFGEKGDDATKTLVHGPLKEAAGGREMPFIIIAPQCPNVSIAEARDAWKNRDGDLMTILGDVEREYRVDKKRLYLTGISMGGFGTFAEAALHADKFAAVAPICGGGDPAKAQCYAGSHFWIFHGDKDPIVNPGMSVKMCDAMKQAGVDVKLTMYPGLQHDSWSVTYSDPAFYAWLLAHRLK